MSKVLSIISLVLTIICIIITIITFLFTFNEYKKNKDTINDLETKIIKLESDILELKMLNENDDDTLGSYDRSYFTKIKPSNIEVLSYNNKMILWIGSPYCSHCAQYAPVITTVGKMNKLPIYYIDILTILESTSDGVRIKDKEAHDILVNLKTDDENKNIMDEFGSTPMTLIIENETIVGSNIGSMGIKNLEDFLRNEGII